MKELGEAERPLRLSRQDRHAVPAAPMEMKTSPGTGDRHEALFFRRNVNSHCKTMLTPTQHNPP